jgi:hypothetical protein
VWAEEGQRQAQTPPRAPKLREAARGEELIGGTVRQKGKKGYVAGKVIGFDGREYDVRLCNGQQVKWSEEEVRDRWIVDQYIMHRGWTAQDQKTLQSGVRGVVAKTMKKMKHRHVTQFPSKNRWEGVGDDGDLVHVHYEDTGARTGTSITHGRKRQAGCRPASDTRNLVLGRRQRRGRSG